MKNFSENEIKKFINLLDFSKIDGNLIPVITQDYETDEILILAFANEEALKKSLKTGLVHYFSRSKKNLWKKGEKSGNVQEIKKIITDCDYDSILFKVKQVGGACHKGYFSCFYNEFTDNRIKNIGRKIFEPSQVYKEKKS
ncbi:MAG: phosphoribosyl-AMP cyclohydrolase [Candidatus Hodarchaeota archaeon]